MIFELAFNLYIVSCVVNASIILLFMFVIYQTLVDLQVLISSVFRHDLLKEGKKYIKPYILLHGFFKPSLNY